MCTPATALDGAARIIADPRAVMGMVVLPRAGLSPQALRRVRDTLLASPLARVLAVADFHPDAQADLTTPARAVPWLRRSPDPTLQVVRLSLLADLRRPPGPPSLADQAALLADLTALKPAPRTVSDQVAARNLDTARADPDAIASAVAAIHADRDRTYARLDSAARAPDAAATASSR